MTLETFFDKFDQFADAPDAVAKMRDIIVRKAITGGFSGSEAANWDQTSLDDLIEVQNGFAFKSSYFNEVREGMPLIRIRDIAADDTKVYYSGDYRDEFIVRNGDLIIGMDGNFNVCRWNGKDALLNQRVCRLLNPQPTADPAFLFISIQEHLDEIHRNTTFTTVKHISAKQIRAISLLLPPLAEQRRIVAKVDELMALCDRLEAQQQERDTRHAALARASLARFAEAPTPANLHHLFHPSYPIPPADLRKSILTLAVQGKLVPQDPNDEPATITCPGLEPLEEDLEGQSSAPDQWINSSYRSLTSLVTSGSRGWKEFYSDSGSIFLRTQNIKTDKIVLDDVAFVDLPSSTEGKRSMVLKGDILITITGANVTKAARVEEPLPEAYISQHIALTRPLWPELSPWFHLCFVSHGSARGALEKLAYGDKPGLNLNNIRNLVLPIPPLAEQRRIVAKVDQLMALVDELETQLAASRATAKNLLEALVTELTTAP